MFNQERYTQLLSEIAPKKIESEEQYDKYLVLAEDLLFGDSCTIEDEMVVHLLSLLIEEYENKHYPITKLEPLEFLKGLMENLELDFEDLVSIIGSDSLTRDILHGICEIDKPTAKLLGEYFKVDYKDFL